MNKSNSIQSLPNDAFTSEPDIVVVIPCFDELDISPCLDSLLVADLPPAAGIEILVIINHPESAAETTVRQSQQLIRQLQSYHLDPVGRIKITYQYAILPDRNAGVGLARKTGMDEAVRRFDRQDKDGIIVNLDADCLVAKNYFLAITDFYANHPNVWAAGIQFEHRLDEAISIQQVEAIVLYELHLRYFIAAQRVSGLPFGFQTIGSCMTVRRSAYEKLGGMNVRQAGEDFYFLHKFISIGRFAEINTTTVYPSARVSKRVPFGTGRAISASMGGATQMTYSWASFSEVEIMVSRLRCLYGSHDICDWLNALPVVIKAYLNENSAMAKLTEIKKETAKWNTFRSRFFQWFNAFRLMKYLHFARHTYADVPVLDQASDFLIQRIPRFSARSGLLLLHVYRDFARNNPEFLD